MGIKGLAKLIADVCPDVIKEDKAANYFGRKIALDASMSLYSFLVAVRTDGINLLTNESGDTTSHLQGFFQRTIRLIEYGLKPIWVFDGKPPILKGGEIARRSRNKVLAAEELEDAKEEGNKEEEQKLVKRTIHVTKEITEESKKILRLMGVPVVEAPGEAEAMCAELCKKDKVWAAGTEDMDALTFGTPRLLRHLTFSEARKLPIQEIHIKSVLDGLGLSMNQFIDFCILCGCDYCDSIKGIGPKRALEFITKYGCIEEALKHLDTEKYPLPENFPYEEVRELFKKPDVVPGEEVDLLWNDPDEAGLLKFLVEEKGFNVDRITKSIQKLKKSVHVPVQGRLDAFVIASPKRPREEEESEKSPKNKKLKTKDKKAVGGVKKTVKGKEKVPEKKVGAKGRGGKKK